MDILKVENLCKRYPDFSLKDVSFSMEEGSIMGFIGRNGAGKTTTLKSILGLVHPDGGRVTIDGRDFSENELYCKQVTALVLGEVDYYQSKKLRDIAKVTRHFYPDWDENAYRDYLSRFSLNEDKRVKELSAGMRVKFNLALALSHKPRLLLLDEPTSGLDPVSRDELIGIFLDLASDGGHSILFSTHIISDLEKCADTITYIKKGQIFDSRDKESFAESYLHATGSKEALTPELRGAIIGIREHDFGFEGLLRTEDAERFDGVKTERSNLEDIMVHIEREETK